MSYTLNIFGFIKEEYISKEDIINEQFFRNMTCQIGEISLTLLGNKIDCGVVITGDMKFASHCDFNHKFIVIPYHSIKSALLTIPSV